MTIETEFITLTPTATQAVRELLEKRNLPDYALRVFIAGSGCSGLQYGMALEGNIRPEDLTGEFDGIKVVVDEVSIDYLRGSTVDYIDDPRGSGFKIENPNFASTCGSNGGCSGCG